MFNGIRQSIYIFQRAILVCFVVPWISPPRSILFIYKPFWLKKEHSRCNNSQRSLRFWNCFSHFVSGTDPKTFEKALLLAFFNKSVVIRRRGFTRGRKEVCSLSTARNQNSVENWSFNCWVRNLSYAKSCRRFCYSFNFYGVHRWAHLRPKLGVDCVLEILGMLSIGRWILGKGRRWELEEWRISKQIHSMRIRRQSKENVWKTKVTNEEEDFEEHVDNDAERLCLSSAMVGPYLSLPAAKRDWVKIFF